MSEVNNRYEIAKSFSCCYGHRVWNQILDQPDFSDDLKSVCRGKHGHEGTIVIYLSSNTLKNGMVIDFRNTEFFKKWVDKVIDHKFIVDKSDPALYDMFLTKTKPENFDKDFTFNAEGYWSCNIENYAKYPDYIQEIYERYVVVNFVPTSENLCKWIHGIVQSKMDKLGVKVSRVQFFETPKSQSNYYAG